MGSEFYKVEVLHYLNPHLIWVLVRNVGEENFHFEQIGIYGILPQNITFEVDCVVTTKRCEQWMPAAVFVMKNAILEASEVWFSPTYIDKKISIFDDNTHKYGDITIILKNGTKLDLLEEIIKSQFAFEDECLFHEELRDNNLKTKVNYITALEVLGVIADGYKTRDIPKNLWQNILKNQTAVLHESKHLETTITSRNLEKHERKHFETLLQNKLNDLKLCKDIEDESAGRASSVKSSRASTVLSVSLRNKLDLLKSYNKTHVLKPVADNKIADYSELKSNGDAVGSEQDKIQDVKVSPNRADIINEDTKNNVNGKIGKKTRKAINTSVNLVAFGPAGLDKSKFNVKPQTANENEEPVIQKKPETEKEVTTEQERDVYDNTDSEVRREKRFTSKIELFRFLQNHRVRNN